MRGPRCRFGNRSTMRIGLSQEPDALAVQGAVAHTEVRKSLIPWTKDRGLLRSRYANPTYLAEHLIDLFFGMITMLSFYMCCNRRHCQGHYTKIIGIPNSGNEIRNNINRANKIN